ncbi:MAG: hypothetical protein WB421_20450 [Terriglobales bacterium]
MARSSPTAKPNRDQRAARVRSAAKSRSRKLEAVGVLIVALLILIVTLARSWHAIAWRAR